jgi:hypothetical protein
MKTDTIKIDVSTRTAFVVLRHGKYDGAAVVTVDGVAYNCHIDGMDFRINASGIADAAWKARTELVNRARVANMKLRTVTK